MKSTTHSTSDKVLAAGLPGSGFIKAELDIGLFGIFCFDHGHCTRSLGCGVVFEILEEYCSDFCMRRWYGPLVIKLSISK